MFFCYDLNLLLSDIFENIENKSSWEIIGEEGHFEQDCRCFVKMYIQTNKSEPRQIK